MDADAFFATPMVIVSEYNESDIETEYQRMMLRSSMTDLFLAGEIDCETFLDCLAEHDYEPETYLDQVEENINFALNHL